ncbi:hypothetical protein [Nitrosococcus wardiae]|uniref:Uncharacterized protein n=1 Tax=Nitrosococcus wardiae TaxID=1814290 RepID=A0A4P7C5S2_9GAMM|nr:hypothetical protein [Nitrosococcus wardiae]QBQ53078.1 hypothetical protein E3U44_00070 [Nitrosococcus wardiae]QBQ56358.1 hypothetical protein E3U44_19030 [Nitrosococcus wardiae]QBQ56376.1 hypothetical protein E3U44_19120 [Nitrosococcus wardiae]
MQVIAWSNGSHKKSGAGYGVKLSIEDRDRYFERGWQSVKLTLEDGAEIEVNVGKKSFWSGTCRELIHSQIGKWLLEVDLAPWPKGNPPKLELRPLGKAYFKLQRLGS